MQIDLNNTIDYTSPGLMEANGYDYKKAVRANFLSKCGGTTSISDLVIFGTLLDEIEKLRNRVAELEQV